VLQELDPLRERARTTQGELEARKEHVTRLEEENRRWQERNSQLLSMVSPFLLRLVLEDADIASQYDRVDPTEFQSLKDELENLRAEKSTLEAQQTTQTEELAQVQEKVGIFLWRLLLLIRSYGVA
jgi:nucleoprotein TPR